MNAHLWTEQFRPTHLKDIAGQSVVKEFLTRIVATASTTLPDVPHLILHGPPGTGKTTMAQAFATDLYPDVPTQMASMYLNASDERTMLTVRDRICAFLRVHWVGVTRKIVIFDEVETMTESAQLTLRALMDSPLIPGTPLPLFVFLCNTLTRIVAPVRSRALTLFTGHLSCDEIRDLMSTKLGVAPSLLPTELTCLLHRGDMRAFIQSAQQGHDTSWAVWFDRLLACPDSMTSAVIVWEDGLARVPVWMLLRHVLLFAYAKGIPAAVDTPVWTAFLEAAVAARTRAHVDAVIAAWLVVNRSCAKNEGRRGVSVSPATTPCP